MGLPERIRRTALAGGLGDTRSDLGRLKSTDLYDLRGSAASAIGRPEATPRSLPFLGIVLPVLGTLTVAFALPGPRRNAMPSPDESNQWIDPDAGS